MRVRALSIALLLVGTAAAARAQDATGGGAQISFRFERMGLPVPRYEIRVDESGHSVYEGEETGPAATRTVSDGDGSTMPMRQFRSTVTISPTTTKKIFAMAKSLKEFNVQCASKAKNIADTGKKTLAYSGTAGHGECTYNYSDNKGVTQLTETFLGIAETMDEGRQLDHLHRYDRLGLDAAIGTLAEEVTQGRAVELGTIAATLRSIAADADLMQRVRLRASQLLSLLPPELQQATP